MAVGDRVIVSGKNKKKVEGVLLPSSRKDVIMVKLDSGYNVGIRTKGTTIKVVAKESPKIEEKKAKIEQQRLPKVTILHTGGTIASQVDYDTGAVIARFSPEEMLQMFPELKNVVHVDSRLLRNMWSGDMRFAHHNIMAKAVAAETKKGVKGVIITHGTDTMGYTAAALAFILEGVQIPVVLVGAQRSSDRGSSDAGLNLLCAAQFITHCDVGGVFICMHHGMSDTECVVLPATKTKKFHSSRRDAFKAVNAEPVAIVSVDGNIKWVARPAKHSGGLKLKLIKDNLKVGILKFHPNLFAEEVSAYKNFDGLVIEGTGLGHGPVDVIDKETKEHGKILTEIKKLASKIPVVMTSQTVFGRIQMDVYAYGRKLQEAGVLGNGGDMLTETAFVKLAWLLSNHTSKVKELVSENLRGETSERSVGEFL